MNELTNLARQTLKEGPEPQNSLVPGVEISWEGADGKIRGPAVIEGVFQVEGQHWVWLTYANQVRFLNAKFILKAGDVPA